MGPAPVGDRVHLTTALERYPERDWGSGADGTLDLALVGLGWWTTEVVLPALRETDACSATVLASGSAETATAAADAHDARAVTYEAFHDGAAAGSYDAVYVGTPNATHLEFVETAAERGKHVLCEKPLEATVERGERLVDAAAEAGVTLMTAYRMQTDPAVRRARELVRSGAIGEPVALHGSNAQPLLELDPDPDQWRLDPSLVGYGTAVMDLGIYPINTARFVLERDPGGVTAGMAAPSPAFDDVPDEHAWFTLSFGDLCLLGTASQNAARTSAFHVLGTDGSITIEPAFHERPVLGVTVGGTRAEFTAPAFDLQRQMREEFVYFAERVLSGESVAPTGRQGLEDLRIIEAIHEAAATGRPADPGLA